MDSQVNCAGLLVDARLVTLVDDEILPGTGISPVDFWSAFSAIVDDFSPQNAALLQTRDRLQGEIDDWYRQHRGQPIDGSAYKAFLTRIGYLVPDAGTCQVTTEGVDDEIASMAGPQLVVPVNNPRYALNAANARWGSLFDALYGSDVISNDNGATAGTAYNPVRGKAVIAYAMTFLDRVVPLDKGSHHNVSAYGVVDGSLQARLADGHVSHLANQDQFVGYNDVPAAPTAVLVRHNNLHIDIQINQGQLTGRENAAGVCDLVIEAALTTIQDCEDSVAAVDAEEKVEVYRHWLGLMKGDLVARFSKGGQSVERQLNSDRHYVAPDGMPFSLHGRSLMLVRNVGHHMTNPAIVSHNGTEIFEGIMDAMMTVAIALHDLQKSDGHCNSRTDSVYVVKPKMHGPEEVAFTVRLFEAVENALGLVRNTIKIGIMDEERRTTVNLKECIRAAAERVIFINTGFLDRTGDEIHTAMEAGPMVPKGEMKQAAWFEAYEDWNVDVGLACDLPGRAQIGKGMWAMPDEMAAMMETKIAHPKAGATTAWVPSPTAATLHALHYHEVDVFAEQRELKKRSPASLDNILTPPVAEGVNWQSEVIERELDNNCQGILGYVVRWIDQGVGCSKVPDFNHIGLMEDRATLRISSQHLANWLYHQVVTESQVMASLTRMAEVVDRQNAGDPGYQPLAPDCSGYAFEAARQLIFDGRNSPNGYTEPLLHQERLHLKASL